jgi:hypothetical protein
MRDRRCWEGRSDLQHGFHLPVWKLYYARKGSNKKEEEEVMLE